MSVEDLSVELRSSEPPWPAIAEKIGGITRVTRAGRSRSTFLVHTPRGALVVKRMTADHDPERHTDLITQLSQPPHALCPRVLGAVILDPTCWYALLEWLDGSDRPTGAESAELFRGSTLDLLGRMRACPVVPERRIESIWLDRLDAHPFEDAGASALLSSLRRAAPEGPRTLAHGDFSVQNFVWSPRGVLLVDWEEVGSAPVGFDAGWMLALARMGHGPPRRPPELLSAFLDAGFPRSNLRWFEALGLLRLLFRAETLPMDAGLRRVVVGVLRGAVGERAARMRLSLHEA